MQLAITKQADVTEGTVEVSDDIFGKAFNEPLVHQVVTAYLAGKRQGSRAQKNRSAVRGGGRKPWRQKGTGRARAGTIRSPLWRGGGRTFPASPQDFHQKVNKKMYRGAIRSVLSELVRQDRLIVLDEFIVESSKTKDLAAKLQALKLQDVLILVESIQRPLYLSARNLKHVDIQDVKGLNLINLIQREKVLVTPSVLSLLGEQIK